MPRVPTRILPAVFLTVALTLSAINCGHDGGPRLPADIVLSTPNANFAATSGGANPVPLVLQITNAGDEPLTGLHATVAYSAGQSEGWLTASLSSTSAPSTLTLTATTGPLRGGDYAGTVTVTSPAAAHGSVTINVTFALARATPAAPSNLTAVAPSPSRIDLAWSDNSPIEDGFRIERCSGATCTDFAYVAGVDPNVTAYAHVGYSDANATYRYRVQAVNAEGLSPFSNIAIVTTPRLPAIALDQSTKDLSSPEGKPGTATVRVGVTNGGDGTLTDLVVQPIVYGSEPRGADWLTATLDRTTAPAVLTLDASPAELVAGTYTATVSLSAVGASNSPQSVAVTFQILRSDLAIVAPEVLTVSPNEVHAPGQVTFPPITVQNVGDGEASHVLVAYLLSRDAVLDRSDRLLIQYGAGPLARSATLEVPEMVVGVPADVADGSYTIGVLVDPDNDVPELRDDNNMKSTGFVVGAPPTIMAEPRELRFTATASGAAPPLQNVAITNYGGRTLSGLEARAEYVSGDAGWMTLQLNQTTAPATLVIGAVPGTLAPGTYTARVWLSSPVATNSPFSLFITFEVSAPAPTAAIGVSAVFLTFSATSGGANPAVQTATVVNNGSGVLDQLSVGTIVYGPGQPAGWLAATLDRTTAPATLTFTATTGTILPGSYVATVPIESPVATNSPQLVSVVFAIAPQLPDLTVTGAAGTPFTVTPTTVEQLQTVTLSPFVVKNIGTLASEPYTIGVYLSSDPLLTKDDYLVGDAVFSGLAPGASLDFNELPFPIPGDVAPGSYYIGILVDGSGAVAEANEGNNAVATALTVTAATIPVPPAAPTALTATVNGLNVTLNWTDNATNEQGFRIERCAGYCTSIPGLPPPDFGLVGTLGSNSTAFTVGGHTSGTSYTYRVSAYNTAGQSYPASVSFVAGIPQAPTNLVATAMSASAISLTWTDNATFETNYEIWRCAGSGCSTYGVVATIGSDATSFQDGGLGETTPYSYRVRALSATGNSGYTNVATATTLPSTIPPAAPTALVATVVSGNQIDLSWVDNATNDAGFRIERCTGATCANFVEIGTTLANVVSYQNGGLAGGTAYRYRIRAYNSVGTSAYTAVASGTTFLVPQAPTALTATVVSSGRVDLHWTDNSTSETGFRIEGCSGATCTNFSLITSVGANVVTYSGGVFPNDRPRYRVYAYNGNGVSAYSNEVGVTVPPLEAPSALTAAALSSARVQLSWTNNAPQFATSQVEVERCSAAACATFSQIADLTQSGATQIYTNTGLTGATSYSYRVRATRAVAQSAWSATVTVTTPVVPATPSGLTASSPSSSSIVLNWTDNSSNETGFRIERCAGTGCTSFTTVTTTAANATSYTNTGLSSASIYRFRVRATDGDVNSDPTNEVTVTTQQAAGTPVAPSNLAAAALPNGLVNLSWIDNASNETGYIVERCAGAGCTNFAVVVNTAGTNVTASTTSGQLPETSYSFRVRVFNAAGNSFYSNTATVTMPVLAAPTNLVATAVSATQINVSWVDNSSNETGFLLERCAGTSCTAFAQVATPGANAAAFVNAPVVSGTTYTYRIRAANATFRSPYSNTATATTP